MRPPSKNVLWQQRQRRVKGKGGPYGKKTKVRVVPMSNRVRTLLEHHFALEKTFPVKARRAQDIVKAVANRAGITKDVTPHVLRHTFATMALQKGISLPTVQKVLGTTVSRPRRSTSTFPTCTSRTSSSGSGENRLISGMSRKLNGLCLSNATAPGMVQNARHSGNSSGPLDWSGVLQRL